MRQAIDSLSRGPKDPRLLVGFDKADDAGVFQMTPDLALVQTIDFFTPIVDDPLWFGRIAAANALSDVYAMGGKPLTALNVLCYPEELGPEIMGKILAGGLEKILEAGAVLVGGHSVRDDEMKYGLSVTGEISPQRIFSNDKLKSGQKLILTKKLGTGVITTAAKRNKCPKEFLQPAIDQMATLNKNACAAMLETSATGCTDVTGFGFLGHLSEMVRGSGLSVKIEASKLPLLDGTLQLIKKGIVTGAAAGNRAYSCDLEISRDVSGEILHAMLDPQTSGGLLISIPEEDVTSYLLKFKALAGFQPWVVGEVLEKSESLKIFCSN